MASIETTNKRKLLTQIDTLCMLFETFCKTCFSSCVCSTEVIIISTCFRGGHSWYDGLDLIWLWTGWNSDRFRQNKKHWTGFNLKKIDRTWDQTWRIHSIIMMKSKQQNVLSHFKTQWNGWNIDNDPNIWITWCCVYIAVCDRQLRLLFIDYSSNIKRP